MRNGWPDSPPPICPTFERDDPMTRAPNTPPDDGTVANPMPDLFVDDGRVDLSDISWLDAPAFIVFWTLMVIVMLQFFTRYVLNDSLGWTEEIARYLLILVTFIGAITCSRLGAHIFLEFFYRYLPRGLIKPVTVLVELINVAFFTAAGFLCIRLAEETAHQNMVSIQWPKGIIYWTVVGCCFAIALTSVLQTIRRLRTPSEELARQMLSPPALT